MWYDCLSEYLLKEGYVNNLICSCIFIERSKIEFTTTVMYVDDLNLVGISKELTKIINYLKR